VQLDTDIMASASIDHIGVVVRDVDKVVASLSSTLGAGPWRIFETVEYYKDQLSSDDIGVGEPFNLKLAFAKLGAITIELLQPLDGKSVYSQFLESKGEGIHHVAFSVSDFDTTVAKLLQGGSKIIAGGFSEGERWAFLDTKSGGMIVEPLENFRVEDHFGL